MKIGLSPKTVERAGASDARFSSGRGIPTIEMGLKGYKFHDHNEYVDLTSLDDMGDWVKAIVEEFCR